MHLYLNNPTYEASDISLHKNGKEVFRLKIILTHPVCKVGLCKLQLISTLTLTTVFDQSDQTQSIIKQGAAN